MKVFIENERGKSLKNIFNEKTLEFKKVVPVAAPYPFPYGFILETTSGDGDNLDCFVITTSDLKTGQIVDVEPLGVLQKHEDGDMDHAILAYIKGEHVVIDDEVKSRLVSFVQTVFSHLPGKRVSVAGFASKEEAERLVDLCKDNP